MIATTTKSSPLDSDLLFATYKKTAPPTTVYYVKFFIQYLKAQTLLIQVLTQQHFESYKSWLLSLRNSDGLFYKVSWILVSLKSSRTFCNWLTQGGHLGKPPFFPIYSKRLKKELCLFYERRQKRSLQQKQWTLSDADLVQKYLKTVKPFIDASYFRSCKQKSLEELLRFSQKCSLSLLELTETHMQSLREEWYASEIHSSLSPSDHTILFWHYAIRSFYRFIYEEGHSQESLFQDWKNPLLLERIKAERRRFCLALPLKKRRYSNKEILKAYELHLRKTFSHYSDCKASYRHLQSFIRFMTSQGKSLYTADESSIHRFKEHLLHHEYQPGCYYSPRVQVAKINSLKRFYDWFVHKSYAASHPLKGFRPHVYQEAIQSLCEERAQNRVSILNLPPAFEKIYQSVTAHEERSCLCKATIKIHQQGWRVFFFYLQKIGIEELKEVDESILEDYQSYLHQLKGHKKKMRSLHTEFKYLSALRNLFRYLARFRYLEKNFSDCITLPKLGQGLPTVGLTDQEVKKLLKAKDPVTDKEVRDRAILETLYSTGVRSNELRNLCVKDLDFGSGLLRVNVPKGGEEYQRVIPIGREACHWIERYFREVRSKQKFSSGGPLFLNPQGTLLSSRTILNIVQSTAFFQGGLRKKVVTHSFRVSCGTEMLKNSADLKYVQQQLGHKSIASTEKYMRLVPMDLKKVHGRCHPREKRNREKKGEPLCSSE